MHEYVEYQLDVENGQIVGCRFFGEGKQTDPLPDLKVYKWSGSIPDRWLQRLEKRLKLIFGR